MWGNCGIDKWRLTNLWLDQTNVSVLSTRQGTCRGGHLLLLHLCPVHSLLPQWQQGKEPGDSCQKIPMSLPWHSSGHWNRLCHKNLQLLGWNRKNAFYHWVAQGSRPCPPWAVSAVHQSQCLPYHQGNHWKETFCIDRQLPNLWKPRLKDYPWFKQDQQAWASWLFGRQPPASVAEPGISLAGQVVPLRRWAKASRSMAELSKKLAWVFCGAWGNGEWTPLLPRKDPCKISGSLLSN